MALTKKMIEKAMAMQERTRSKRAAVIECSSDGRGRVVHELGDLAFINELDRTARRIAAEDEVPIDLTKKGVGSRFILTPLGKIVARLCRNFDPEFPTRHCLHVFNPFIATMVRVCRRCSRIPAFCKPIPGVGIAPVDVKAMDSIVRFVRLRCRSKKFRRKVDNCRRLAFKNYRSACKYFISLFGTHSRLLMVRIDLYYRAEGKAWANSEEADAAFERFLRALRESRIVPDVCGWVSRREVGPVRDIHYHILVAMDGHKHKDAFGFANKIGEYWVDHCTGPHKLGSFFNCYALRDEYQFNGLGLVHICDESKFIGLRAAIRYITKGDYQVKTKASTERNFRRGLIASSAVKLGAPRKEKHDMSVVTRILGASVS